MSRRTGYIGAIRADQTIGSGYSDLFTPVGNTLVRTRVLTHGVQGRIFIIAPFSRP